MLRSEKAAMLAQSLLEKARSEKSHKFDYSLVNALGVKSTKDKVELVCLIHGVQFSQRLSRHAEGLHGCSECQKERKQTKRIDFEEFVRRSRETHGDRYSYDPSSYVAMSEPTSIFCGNHGEFIQIPYKHYGGNSCPDCANEARISKLQKPLPGRSLGEMSLLAVQNWDPTNELTPFEVSCKSNVEVKWKCASCTYCWTDSPKTTLNRRGCPHCGFGEEFLEFCNKGPDLAQWARENKPELLLEFSPLNEYRAADLDCRSQKRVIWCCSRYASHPDWKAAVNARTLRQQGCRSCSESKGELKIATWLYKHQIPHAREYSPQDLRNPRTNRRLRYDFAIEDRMILIEYDGIHHFEPMVNWEISNTSEGIENLKGQQYRDRLKDQWAKTNGWTLYRIGYLDDWEARLEAIFTPVT